MGGDGVGAFEAVDLIGGCAQLGHGADYRLIKCLFGRWIRFTANKLEGIGENDFGSIGKGQTDSLQSDR